MKLTWHIVKKDVWRLRWALLLLGAVVVGQFYATWSQGPRTEAESAMLALWGMQLLLVWLLVPQFVQEDPLLGPAEWRVRPISGARLLGAKALGIFLTLCVWPSVLTAPWWLVLGLGFGEALRVIAVNTLGMVLFTGLALAVAVFTENLARFIAWSLVLVAAVGMVALVVAAGLPANGDGPVNAAVLLTRVSLAGVILWAAVVGMVPLQFLGRRPGLARGIAVGAAVAMVLVIGFWPWSEAELWARTGSKRHALPQVSARLAAGALLMPAEGTRPEATAQVTTEFAERGLAAGDQVTWNGAEAAWSVGPGRSRTVPIAADRDRRWETPLATWAKGDDVGRDDVGSMTWSRRFPGNVASVLRNGEGLVRAQNQGTLWRGERGPVAPVRAGAGAAHGLRSLHVMAVEAASGMDLRKLSWLEIEPLYVGTMMLELLNPDGVARQRWRAAVLSNGSKEEADFGQGAYRPKGLGQLGKAHLPVGLMTVTTVESSFGWGWWMQEKQGVPFEGATLASVVITAAAPLEVALAETQFLPDLVVEGSQAEALRRAQAEDRLALVRVAARSKGNESSVTPLYRWGNAETRKILAARFVTGQATAAETARLRKPNDEEGAAILVVFNARGEEIDRLRDLGGEELTAALQANLAGKSYAATLTEALATAGRSDRRLRFQMLEALRARGELVGAFNAILMLMENPREESAFSVVNDVGWRLERWVATDGTVKAELQKRWQQAAEALRRDEGDAGAARLLMVTTLALQHDDAVWRELPRLLPRSNPLWWDFIAVWLGGTIYQKRYREAAEAVELEKFFAAGPAWVRGQLARRAELETGRTGQVGDWQRQLVLTGRRVVEALAGVGQGEAALRVAWELRRIDHTSATRENVRLALARSGAEGLAQQWIKETNHGR